MNILKIVISKISEIILTIDGTGTQSILDSSFNYLPSQVFVNDEQVAAGNTVNILGNNINIIKMIWNYTLTDCSNMFNYLSNIIYADLSNFDFSNVILMERMFYYCINLKSINLNNLNTSSVTNMRWLFFSCYNLISLNLSNFNTSSLILSWSMFAYCTKLMLTP